MQHHEEIAGATASQIHDQVTSKEFLVAFGDELGVTTNSIELSEPDGARRAVLEWSFSTQKPGIPSMARKFLSDEVNLTWEQTWHDGDADYAGELLVTLAGKPSAQSKGTCEITGSANGATLVTDTSTRTSLPRMVSMGIESTIDKELVGWIISVQARVLRRRLDVA